MSLKALVGIQVKVCLSHSLFFCPLISRCSFLTAWQQHDVQELCRVMFDALEKRFRKDGYERSELINELYQGSMKDYVKCLEVSLLIQLLF